MLITMYYIICTGFDEFIEHRRADEGSGIYYMISSPSKSQLRGFIVIHTAVQKPEQVHLAMKAAL